MNRELPPYASSYRDRHGGCACASARRAADAYPKAPPGTEEFWEEYLAWKNAARQGGAGEGDPRHLR
jgi:hypothetical protein